MDQLCKRIDRYYDNMVSTLETLVNIDSGADCPEGIKEVAANVGDHLKSIGFQVEYLDYPGIATHVLATRKGTAPDARNVIIIGHLDTNSTAVYLKVDMERLAECPLDFEEVIHLG